MFAKLAAHFICASALVAGVVATPLAYKPTARDMSLSQRSSHSFNNWGGHASLSNFDNFYGSDNFSGSSFSQTIVEQQQEVVCHTERIEIIQQRLVVLQEMAKRIISEQICEVETQTIVFEQFHSSLGSFSNDLRRFSGHQVGYDQSISSHFNDIVSVDGSLSTHDFGFSGHDVGSHTIVPHGSNWNSVHSPITVGHAFASTQDAISSIH